MPLGISASFSALPELDDHQDDIGVIDDPLDEAGLFMPLFIPILRPEEESVDGAEMLRRARIHNPAGRRRARAMFREQHKIPERLRRYTLLFPATILHHHGGFRSVWSLQWRGECWYLLAERLCGRFYKCHLVIGSD